ncbi:uncharacterized protein DFL_001985 [Arthrobotrys flagrans]|uniref:Uncharacterized protein n=1 Tax=Arthrobotrys flagrans TaxID=97331 RepID=A0A437A972_ARTFL|nr:hypothetical protein DFL_001985 [Arthrobotrys flagrans]
MTPATSDTPKFASIDEAIAKAIAADGAVSPPPPAQAPAPSKVKGLIAAWSQRAEASEAIPKKPSLTGLKHLPLKHVQTKIQRFSQPTGVINEIVKIKSGLIKQRIAVLEDVKAGCQYALDCQQNYRPQQGQLGARPTVATPTEQTPSPDRDVSTPSPTPTVDVASLPDSVETEPQALMREIEGMDIMSSASTDYRRETGLSVGASVIPPLTGTARVFGTRRYRREPLTEVTHWLKAKKPAAAISIGTNVPVIPARLLQGAQSQPPIAKYYTNNYDPGNNDVILPPRIHKIPMANVSLPPTPALLGNCESFIKYKVTQSQPPIAKYYTNNYDPENNDVILPLRIHKMPMANVSLPPAPAPLGNCEGFIEYKVAGRFGILRTRPRLVATRPRFGENLAPTKARGNQVPKLRHRTPLQVTIDFFNKI